MSLAKAIARNEGARSFLCRLAALYIRLVHWTGRWQFIDQDAAMQTLADNSPAIMAFWHGRILMMAAIWPKRYPLNMLISQHRDGELIARTIGYFGFEAVRGSTTKAGVQALRTLVRGLGQGVYAGVTPDGPHGPRMRASDGVIAVARLSGAAVVPISYSASWRIVLSSWDRFIVPLPFTRGVVVYGEPVRVARNADEDAREAARRTLEDRLNAITADADRACGHESVAPAPEPRSLGEGHARLGP
ncbi:MAG TPA: lysophospholipid acyltransferase family protein [Alphaproteobacteria bacterium]|nr:lysophospholipid acyltransferase family protein [Alphaproteobacteria bacterium]